MSDPIPSNPIPSNPIKSQLTRLGRAVFRRSTLLVALLAFGGYELAKHPPIGNIERGEVGIRLNRFTGGTTQSGEGAMLVIPGVHELRLYSLQDQMYHPERSSKAGGPAPFQSAEGLSLGVDLTIRYALDPARLAAISQNLPADISGEVVEPLVQGVI